MPDMLAKLYDLPDLDEPLAGMAASGIDVRAALVLEKPAVLAWVAARFQGWTAEAEVSFSRLPVACHVAVRDRQLLGFACYDAACRNFFGPMGVEESARKQGVGRALLLSVLHAQRAQGYAYSIIGGVGPAEFYARTVGAVIIDGSDLGILALVEEDPDSTVANLDAFNPSNPFGEPEPEPEPARTPEPVAVLAEIPRDSALAAFMDGAQLDLSTMRGAEPAAVLKRAGRLYRQIIGHVHDLLRDRSAVKAQFRAEQTMVTPANANPFKSLMPDELAVRLLRSDQKGYLASEEAVEATFRDVKRHQLAVLSGMHRALVGLVNRLNPDEIEELLGKRSTMSIVTAGGKKAAAWDTYRAYFEQLERDIADLDRSSFMADFRRGYDDRLRQLQNADL